MKLDSIADKINEIKLLKDEALKELEDIQHEIGYQQIIEKKKMPKPIAI